MRSFVGWRFAAVASVLLALPLAIASAACGADAGDGTSQESNATDGSELEIVFPKMYSGFDGVHDYRIPAKVIGVTKVKWSAEPADAVQLDTQSDGTVLITIKSGDTEEVKITAKAGPLRATAPLHITKYTSENWTEGDERYNNGVVWKRGGKGDGGGGGKGGGGDSDGGKKGDRERRVDPSLSCVNCHNKGGKGGDVEHTPMQTGGFTDEELITIFSEGKKPAGVKMRTTTAEKWQKLHKWEMEPEEKKGIVSYLRSLEPEEQGEVDFGGRGGGKRGDGDGKKGGKDDDDDKKTDNEDGDAGASTN